MTPRLVETVGAKVKGRLEVMQACRTCLGCLDQFSWLPRSIFAVRFYARCQAYGGIAENRAMINAQSLDPALLSQGKADEKAELDQLGNREVLMQLFP